TTMHEAQSKPNRRVRNAGRNCAPSALPMTTCAAISSTSGMRPSTKPRWLATAAMKSGVISQPFAERVRETNVAATPHTPGGPRRPDKKRREGFGGPAAGNRNPKERPKAHDGRAPRRRRDHDRLEMPAIVRSDRRRFDDAAGDGGKECRDAVDPGEPHVKES